MGQDNVRKRSDCKDRDTVTSGRESVIITVRSWQASKELQSGKKHGQINWQTSFAPSGEELLQGSIFFVLISANPRSLRPLCLWLPQRPYSLLPALSFCNRRTTWSSIPAKLNLFVEKVFRLSWKIVFGSDSKSRMNMLSSTYRHYACSKMFIYASIYHQNSNVPREPCVCFRTAKVAGEITIKIDNVWIRLNLLDFRI